MAGLTDMRCSACAAESTLVSDARAVLLDDGTFRFLRHPIETYECKALGLTLDQASARRRLFHATFFACRTCGGEVPRWRRVDGYREFSLDPKPWELLKFAAPIGVVWILVAWWRGWDDGFWIAICFTLATPFVDMAKQRELRRERAKRGEPEYPTADAPGRVEIAEPELSPTCCERPDLVEAMRVTTDDRLPCRACGRGVLVVVGHGIS